MAMKLEKKQVTMSHQVDGMNRQSIVIDRNKSVEPNAGLRETVDALGNKGRLNLQYTVGKNPKTTTVLPGNIEGMRPSKAEMRNG